MQYARNDGESLLDAAQNAIPAGQLGSAVYQVGYDRFLLDLREGHLDAARRVLSQPRLERDIGVIYRPETER